MMTPASKGAAAKKAPASRPAAAKKAAPAKKSPAPAKKVAPAKKATPPAKKTVVAKKVAPAKKAPAPAKKVAPAKKAAPAAKKAPAPAKKAAPAAKKKAAPAPEVVAPPRTTFTRKPTPPAPVRPKVGPYAKDEKFLEEVKELLIADRAIYAEQAASLRAEADSLALEREPGDVQFDEESGEGGTVTVDRERNLALSGQALLAVEEIDYALERIADKSYGTCERCFQPIPKPRLRALPYARLCVACKSGGLSRR
jgi:RNA polymerase-binding transcription factor DksA